MVTVYDMNFESCRFDEESAKRTELEKVRRELEIQVDELKEDLEAEKSSRTKAEKQRRELEQVSVLLTNILQSL